MTPQTSFIKPSETYTDREFDQLLEKAIDIARPFHHAGAMTDAEKLKMWTFIRRADHRLSILETAGRTAQSKRRQTPPEVLTPLEILGRRFLLSIGTSLRGGPELTSTHDSEGNRYMMTSTKHNPCPHKNGKALYFAIVEKFDQLPSDELLDEITPYSAGAYATERSRLKNHEGYDFARLGDDGFRVTKRPEPEPVVVPEPENMPEPVEIETPASEVFEQYFRPDVARATPTNADVARMINERLNGLESRISDTLTASIIKLLGPTATKS